MSDGPEPTDHSATLASRLVEIIRSTADAIVSEDLDGKVVTWNGGAERIFGYSAEEMIGRDFATLIPPERRREGAEILQRIRRGEPVSDLRTLRLRKDGQRLMISVTVSPLHDAQGRVVGASRIVRSTGDNAELEARYQAIVASSDDAIITKGLDGIVRSWNDAAERIFGYTADEMVGHSITRLIPADRQDEEPTILARLAGGERVHHFETVRRRKDGSTVDVSVTISPILAPDGRVVGASKIARDVSRLKRFISERERLLAREQAARHEAERLNRAKDEFLATLSHELRTPLHAVLGWSHLLRTTTTDATELRHGLETIERNARMQAQLIDELLDMSRIISGKMRLDVQSVDLAGVISDSVESLRPAAAGKQISLVVLLDPRAGPIQGDPARLQQVVWNLLSNAIKFTPKRGRVKVVLQRINSHVEIIVSDTGHGIEADFLPQLFTRFAQADGSTTRRHGGLGLGLAICRQLVELHGGTIDATSAGPNTGSTFTVALPLTPILDERSPSLAAHPTSERPRPSEALDLQGIRVLVVDDEAESRELLERMLASHGATIATAGSAAEALDLVRTQQPDLLLTDIGMPDQDGYQLLQALRAMPPEEGGRTPAVALTAFARSEDRRRALMAGFQLHVAKPVDIAELLAVVSSVARGAGHRRPPDTES